jgi:hypothetical protein
MTLQEIKRLEDLCKCDPRAGVEIIINLQEEDYNSLIDNFFYMGKQTFTFYRDFFVWTDMTHRSSIVYKPNFVYDKRRST